MDNSVQLFRRKREKEETRMGADLHSLSKEHAGDMLQSALVDIVQRNAILLAKAFAVTLFAAEILALFGLIGERGEGLYRWAAKNKALRRNVFDKGKMGLFLKQKAENMLQDFITLSPRQKFAAAVSLGVMTFPLFVKTSIVTIKIVLGGFVFAEGLAFVGIIGERGESLSQYVKDGEHEKLLTKCRRVLDQQRLQLRKKLQIRELISRLKDSLGDDHVFWAGFGLGTLASLCISDDEYVRI